MITALAAELRIALKDNPWPFFEHTDLLDFPGYRGRTQHNLAKYLSEAKASALKELFLRGKGEYLFQRYTAEQELTSMLLCLPPGNPDVTTLPAVIEEWIAVTHGRTPEERRGRPTLLFFLLTMFDQHLVEQAEDEATAPGSRFQARLEASLLKPFAKVADSWPLRWTPEEPFRNCYWIRSPYYKAEGIIQYEGRHEEQIHERKMARIDQLRTASIGVPQVQAHFHDPLRAFHEVMNLNDGGVAYVAENLAQVCKPGMKREQVRARLLDLRRRVARALAPHYIQADAEKRTADRIAVADQVINDFEECIARHAFGTFLRGLCLARGDLADALHEAVTNGGQSEDSDDEGRDKVPSPKSNRSSLLDMVKSGKPASGPSAGGVRRSRADQLVWAAMQLWTQTLHEASEDEGFSAAVGVPGETLKQIAIELIATSRRIGLEMSIRSALANTFHFGTAEQAAAKATLVAERLIGRFVTELEASVDLRPPPVFDAKGIGDKAANFQQEFAIAWLRAFYAHVIANAQSVDGQVHDPEQNQRLGRILRQFEGTSNASAR
jgi:hypothetical protein